ncbi:MAG: TIGR00730 family Rossman fold protein [Bdellovibrionales bacterium]|nr:TIGR00730 family Rossman fold protein [Bdellovibrionales bacterium]
MSQRSSSGSRRRRLTERLSSLRQRAFMLEQELKTYTSGFFRVCIFGSARIQPDDAIYRVTEELGRLLGHEGIDVLTGGGPGLMEAANKGVLQGKKESGSKSKSFGISIELPFEADDNEHLDIKHHHRRFSSRLDDFMRLSNIIICTPGGIGTLLELYFSWQLLQVGHMTERPIILLGKDFWSGLIEWMKEHQIQQGLVSAGDLRWIQIVDTPNEAMEIIRVEFQHFNERKQAQGLQTPTTQDATE